MDSVVLPVHAQASGPLASAYATTGVGGTISDLYSVNVVTGTTTLIGSVGYAVNAIAYYGGTLYGLERQGGALLTINTTTGAGTAIGSLGGDNVTSFAISPAGDGFGWSESNDSFRSIDLATGATTQIGSGIPSGSHGMAFLGATLYFHNYDGSLYTIDTSTGATTLVGNTGLGRQANHGSVNPANSLYYGLNFPDDGSSPVLNRVDLPTATAVGSVATDRQLHTLAFTT